MMISEPGTLDKFIAYLKTLTDMQRVGNIEAILHEFCRHCGVTETPGRRCQCNNDE